MFRQGDELSETNYPIDTENVVEMDRLTKQARLVNEHVGLLPSQVLLTKGQIILDIACGPGEWALEVARNYPGCQVVGIDISERMITYARSTARVRRLSNVQFEIANARQPLPFPDASFDIIHIRLVASFLSTAAWPLFLAECFRVLRPGGVVCSTELENMGISTSAALTCYNELIVQFMRQRRQCFSASRDTMGIMAVQAHLLQTGGFAPVYQQVHVLNYSAGMPAHPLMIENWAAFMQLIQPALFQGKLIEQEELSLLYTQALAEMHAENFCAVMLYQTAWGRKPA